MAFQIAFKDDQYSLSALYIIFVYETSVSGHMKSYPRPHTTIKRPPFGLPLPLCGLRVAVFCNVHIILYCSNSGARPTALCS